MVMGCDLAVFSGPEVGTSAILGAPANNHLYAYSADKIRGLFDQGPMQPSTLEPPIEMLIYNAQERFIG